MRFTLTILIATFAVVALCCSATPPMPGDAVTPLSNAVGFAANVEAVKSQSQCKSINGLPDPICTPGVARTQDVNDICHAKTSTVRPPLAVTEKLKGKLMAEYGYKGQSYKGFELDHLIPLEIGGDPLDEKNLWPQLRKGKNNAAKKDLVENFLHRQICSGKMTPAAAQAAIASNWTQVKIK